MITKIIVEAIVYSLIYTVFMVSLFKVQGAKKNKTVDLLVMIILSVIISCAVNKENTFFAGFWQSYIFFNAFSLFDALVFDTIWFCHGKWWVIPGTEDMTDAYHDYAFHWKWFFLSLVMTLPLAVINGGIVALVGRIL